MSLLEHDQLSIERRTEDSPLGVFREHPILFPPTYKLDAISISDSESDSDPITATTNSSTYFADSASEHQTRSSSSRSLKGRHKRLHHHHSSLELQVDPRVPVYGSPSIILRYDSSEKKRIPSWTDRILWCDRASSHHLQPPCVSRSTKKPSFISKSLSVSKTLLNIGPKKQTKPTLCYSYDTILHETILGKSDHLPVVGVYGVYIDKIKPMKVSKPSFSRTSTNVQPSKASVHSKKKRTKFMWWKALVGSQK
ncbi:hypothetical protein BDB01DRAFT_433978 [Pilobolus umbonatus]|nr:hypothetical protein BDB01DRAFT_433978 [Pilobolus umbonatus]